MIFWTSKIEILTTFTLTFTKFSFKISKKDEEYYLIQEEDMEADEENILYYLKQMDLMKSLDRRVMFIDVKHLMKYDDSSAFNEAIFSEYYRYQ